MLKNIALFLTFVTLSTVNLFSSEAKDPVVTDYVVKNLKKSVDASFFGYLFGQADWKARTTAPVFTGQVKTTMYSNDGDQIGFTLERNGKLVTIQSYLPVHLACYKLSFSILAPLLTGARAQKADIPMSMDPKTTCWVKDKGGQFNGVVCQTVLEFNEFVKMMNTKR